MITEPLDTPPNPATVLLNCDRAINYAFQQNSIPIVRELRLKNDNIARKNLTIRISTEPAFAAPSEIRLQSIEAMAEFYVAPLDLKLGHDFLAGLNEKISGWLKAEILHEESVICTCSEPISLLAKNEWCGLASLPEILAAFSMPNDPSVMSILSRASELLREHTGRAAFNSYQDKNRKRAWEQIAAIYKAVGELGIRYIVAPASFEKTGQKVRSPSDILSQRFGNCLDLALLFSACCEQIGLHPLVLMHEGHAYAGCWLEERTLPEPTTDDLQHIRKLATDSLITVFETTLVASETPGTLNDAEILARAHLKTELPFRIALDLRRSRIARIHPLPVPGQINRGIPTAGTANITEIPKGLGDRDFVDPIAPLLSSPTKLVSRIDHWKSRLLDLSLRNRLLNFRETKATVQILTPTPEHVEDELSSESELSLRPKPKLMGEDDPRNAVVYTKEQRADAYADHLRDELRHRRLHTDLDESEHARRLTELYRAARNAIDENGTNTLFAAVGFLEWRETEYSDRSFMAPLLLVPVELKRRSVLEGFSLRRLDEETRLNVTLMEMLRQHFQKEIPGLDPLPEDDQGVNVARVFQLFRDAVRDLPGWEVKTDIWLGQFSFTKFLLWKDLSDRLEELTRNRIVRHLVHDAGTPYANSPDDIHPRELDTRFHARDIFCPRSADSSQLAAVMAAAAGHDFVLEGPPGTGKSQTITNIIAHCLAHGKRVLFVAEKRAALEVVHRRLREEGLEPFCLELHSNKTGKADVLAQFDRSLKLANETNNTDWEHRVAELERVRASLNDYTQSLHHRRPCGLSAHHCLDYLLPRQGEITVKLEAWPSILDTSAVTLDRARELAKLLQNRSRPLLPLLDHPLALLACENWSPVWAERMSDRISALNTTTRTAIESTRELQAWLRYPKTTATRSDLSNLGAFVSDLLAPEPVGPAFALTPWNQLSLNLDSWISLFQERVKLRRELTFLHEPPNPSLPIVACEAWEQNEAERVFEKCKGLCAQAKTAAVAIQDMRTWLKAPSNLSSRLQISHFIGLVDSLLTPHPVAAPFVLTPWQEWITAFDYWIGLIRERVELREKLDGYDENLLIGLDLEALNDKWQSAKNAWILLKWIRINSVRQSLGTVRLDQIRPEIATLEEVLRSGLRLGAINKELASINPQAESLLGPAWSNGEPELEHLLQIREWGATLHQRMTILAGGNLVWLRNLQEIIGGLLSQCPTSFGSGTPVGTRLDRFVESINSFEETYSVLVVSARINRLPLDDADDHLGAVTGAFEQFLPRAHRIRSVNAELLATASTAQACLGRLWANGEPSVEAILRARDWGKKLHADMLSCAGDDLVWLGQLRQLLSNLFSEGAAVYTAGTSIGNRLNRYLETQVCFQKELDDFAFEISLRREAIDGAIDFLGSVFNLTERIASAWPKIREWCSWQKVRHEASTLGLGSVIAKLETENENVTDIPSLFERSFRRSLLFAIIEQAPALREFFGAEHNERINRFREIDEHIATLTRELIRARLTTNIPRDQIDDGVPKAEIGLLRREIAKKARHIPVRRLLGSIPKLLPRLKPCVLMSPLSVAQYLEPSHEHFDVVIFDEASQIPVWDSIGAIARGSQLIVVGDPKQLPPTNFFNNTANDEDDLTPEEHKDLESILDELLTHGVRHKQLLWHYRSRHESLITFSNRQYYENNLLTFPAAETELGGVRFKHLPAARYDKGKSRTNLGEAEALIKELVKRLQEPEGKRRSYGVVTFSLAQQQLVENLLDEERRKHPEIEVHFGDEPPIEGEPVIVKNLENVQGDERDVIFFSICYGPDESGRVSMNFGPLNRDGGERRLNVAITRAKHEVVVFSGLRADQIDLARTRAKGVRDLKYFLDYADRGPRALAAATNASSEAIADSEFERMVANRIRAAGFDVHHQVGCSGYRIDLGIVDPAKPGRYLLGVECDGATYHQAATARDRDKLRQHILEGLGWKLYRIWSTDWWHDAEKEAAKLVARINELIQR